MLDSLLQLDYSLLNWIHNTLSFSWGDYFFPWITDLHKNPWSASLIVAALVFFLIREYKTTGLKLFGMLILCLACVDFTGSTVKNAVERKRPFETQIVQTTQKSPAGSKSFYSNHASNMAALAFFVSAFVPILKIPLLLMAFLVAYSRIYNGVHYPSDVVAGVLMGILISWVFVKISRKILFSEKNKAVTT